MPGPGPGSTSRKGVPFDLNRYYNNNNRTQPSQQSAMQAVVYRSSPIQGTPAYPDGAALAMAYVPSQHWNTTFDTEVGLCKGTIFPELDLPFTCGRCHA